MNALRTHADIRGSIMIVSGEPCLMCAKLIHHSGIEKVFTIQGSYSAVDGVNYLRDNNIEVIKVNNQGDIL
jgi:dCMP deaminase